MFRKKGDEVWYTEKEICDSYDNAICQQEQIEILADLNGCQMSKIIEVLRKNGREVEMRKRWTPEEDKILLELTEQGYSNREIGIKTDATQQQAAKRKSHLRKKAAQAERIEPVQSAEPARLPKAKHLDIPEAVELVCGMPYKIKSIRGDSERLVALLENGLTVTVQNETGETE